MGWKLRLQAEDEGSSFEGFETPEQYMSALATQRRNLLVESRRQTAKSKDEASKFMLRRMCIGNVMSSENRLCLGDNSPAIAELPVAKLVFEDSLQDIPKRHTRS